MDARQRLSNYLENRTQAELARDLDISEAYVSQILAGKRGISIRVAKGLGEITGIPAAQWLNLEPAE